MFDYEFCYEVKILVSVKFYSNILGTEKPIVNQSWIHAPSSSGIYGDRGNQQCTPILSFVSKAGDKMPSSSI